MDSRNFALAQGLVDSSYVSQAKQSRSSREGLVRQLLANRRLPERGWDDVTIKLFLHEIASMDSNNFPGNVGLGEREGRVYSSLVKERNFHLHHGIGRSGDIGAVQPKAAGSSLVLKIAGSLALVRDSHSWPEVQPESCIDVTNVLDTFLSVNRMRQRQPVLEMPSMLQLSQWQPVWP
mmetsp:Transcript_1601/g.5746  ORF Transcript_1601/g.5746 Transcript_1601/m.5746 type:complete len:178 (-) Transcript_1601:4948-5481(-)